MNPSIQTFTGREFNYLDPMPHMIYIDDIGWSLSQQPRFAGHAGCGYRRHWFHWFRNYTYSIAQHSVHVSYLVPEWLALDALLHNAAEAYTLDMPTPLKQLLPDYRAIYDRVELAVCAKFYVDVSHPAIKEADQIALATEVRDLLEPATWWKPRAKPHANRVKPMSQQAAYRAFIKRYEELK